MSDQCQERVYSSHRSDFGGHRCSRKAVKEGFCRIHTPEYVAERRRKSQEAYEEKMKNSVYGRLSEAREKIANLRKILKDIANIAHHGGLKVCRIGCSEKSDALNEIRRISLEFWDKDECDLLNSHSQQEQRL